MSFQDSGVSRVAFTYEHLDALKKTYHNCEIQLEPRIKPCIIDGKTYQSYLVIEKNATHFSGLDRVVLTGIIVFAGTILSLFSLGLIPLLAWNDTKKMCHFIATGDMGRESHVWVKHVESIEMVRLETFEKK